MEHCKKKCHFGKFSEVEKLKLKNLRPTPGIAVTQDWSSYGMKFLFLNYLNFRFSSLVRFIFTVLYCNKAENI